MTRKTRNRIFFALSLALMLGGGYTLYRKFGPGWRYITPTADKWAFKDLGEGKGEVSCEFTIDDTSSIRDLVMVADDEKEVEVFLNDRFLVHLNGFYYLPLNRKKDPLVLPYHAVQPHVLDIAKTKKLLKAGRNTLTIRFTRQPFDKERFRHWALAADSRVWDADKRAYYYPSAPEWKPTPGFASIRIDVPENNIPDEPKVKAKLKLRMKDGTDFRSDIRIEARGRSTLRLMQKSFGFRLTNKKSGEADKGIPGMGKGSEWILYAPACDLSMIRNAIAYDLYRDMGHYSVRYEPVELVINGRYRGIYYLMQRIQIGPDRLDLRYDTADVNNPANSAFLVQIDQADSNDCVIHTWYSHFIVQKIRKKIPPTPYNKFLSARLELMLRYTYQRDTLLPRVIDYTSFADYILLQELSRNEDAYRLSTYFYKDHDSVDPMIHLGPVWDFNLAFGLPGTSDKKIHEGWIHEHREAVDSFWTILFERPDFRDVLTARYRLFRKTLLSGQALHQRITASVARLEPAIEQNQMWLGWPKDMYWPYEVIPKDRKEETDRMEEFLRRRLAWMDTQLLSP
jgi:hypothetical protein